MDRSVSSHGGKPVAPSARQSGAQPPGPLSPLSNNGYLERKNAGWRMLRLRCTNKAGNDAPKLAARVTSTAWKDRMQSSSKCRGVFPRLEDWILRRLRWKGRNDLKVGYERRGKYRSMLEECLGVYPR
ncbi:hypothetical protein KM043_012701 [Ampulex compressa]|nr:hypothetical protein KM043_012701 [Ampulex compressa]